MNNIVISEEAIHYVVRLLDRYSDSHPSKLHKDTLNEFRILSDKLIETLEQPTRISIYRHRLNKE